MNKVISALFATAFLIAACKQHDTSQSTAPADYADTYKKLTNGRDTDSTAKDSTALQTVQPPNADSMQQRK